MQAPIYNSNVAGFALRACSQLMTRRLGCLTIPSVRPEKFPSCVWFFSRLARGQDKSPTQMRCFEHADTLRAEGYLLGSQQLEPPATAKSMRIRSGRTSIIDGPFAETKEVLAGST